MKFYEDEIEVINTCLSIHHSNHTLTYEQATLDDIVHCVHNEYMNTDYHNDALCEMTANEHELIKYVKHMCDVAHLYGRIIGRIE